MQVHAGIQMQVYLYTSVLMALVKSELVFSKGLVSCSGWSHKLDLMGLKK